MQRKSLFAKEEPLPGARGSVDAVFLSLVMCVLAWFGITGRLG